MKIIAPTIRLTLLLIIPIGILLLALAPGAAPLLGKTDFMGYWSTVRLLIQQQNPYDLDLLYQVQHAANPLQATDLTVIAWNPPWLMALLAPLGLLPFHIASAIWMLSNLILLGLAALLSWQLLAPEGESDGFAWILAACFLYAESLILIQIGQITTLVLIGWLAALWLLKQDRNVLAGIALHLTAIKPHLTFLAVLILLIWVIRRRRWGVFAGLLTTLVGSMALVSIIYPAWISDYFNNLGGLPYGALYTSTLGSFMSVTFGVEVFRYSAIVLILLIPFLVKLAEKDLFTSMNLAFVISVPLSPYGFSFDQVVILPAIAQLIYWLTHRQLPQRTAWILGAGLVAVYAINLWLASIRGLPYHWFVWIPIAIAALFIWGYRSQHHANS